MSLYVLKKIIIIIHNKVIEMILNYMNYKLFLANYTKLESGCKT